MNGLRAKPDGQDGGSLVAARRYEVDVTARETFTVVIEASSAREARRIALHPDTQWLETWTNGDRKLGGVKAVRRAD